jgi:hypothetical protein
MDMLDYRLYYAVMATEDRVRSLRRERTQERLVPVARVLPVDRKAPRQPKGTRRDDLSRSCGLLRPRFPPPRPGAR